MAGSINDLQDSSHREDDEGEAVLEYNKDSFENVSVNLVMWHRSPAESCLPFHQHSDSLLLSRLCYLTYLE